MYVSKKTFSSKKMFSSGKCFHQKSSVCFLTALTFAASHTNFYQKILITTKVSFEKHIFHESRNQGKSGTWFRFWSLTLWQPAIALWQPAIALWQPAIVNEDGIFTSFSNTVKAYA